MAKPQELRNLAPADLHQRIETVRTELMGLRLKASQGSIDQPHRIRQLRKDIARILTLLREQQGQPRQPSAKG